MWENIHLVYLSIIVLSFFFYFWISTSFMYDLIVRTSRLRVGDSNSHVSPPLLTVKKSLDVYELVKTQTRHCSWAVQRDSGLNTTTAVTTTNYYHHHESLSPNYSVIIYSRRSATCAYWCTCIVGKYSLQIYMYTFMVLK